MNASNNDVDQCIKIIKENEHIQHINFGRNRICKKHTHSIAQILLSPKHQIQSLCLDSTCLGRISFIELMNAAAISTNLNYLDVADVSFINTLSKHDKHQDYTMYNYHRRETINSIINLLQSTKNNLQHLIIGHNDLQDEECKLIGEAAAHAGLITLDLCGNNIDSEELINIHNKILQQRKQLLREEINKKKDVPGCVTNIIIEYTIHESQSLYRCHKWRPRERRNSR